MCDMYNNRLHLCDAMQVMRPIMIIYIAFSHARQHSDVLGMAQMIYTGDVAYQTGKRRYGAACCGLGEDAGRSVTSECEGQGCRQPGTTGRTFHRSGRASTPPVQ